MRKSWLVIVVLLVAFVLSAPSLAMGKRPQRGPQFDRAKMEEHIVKKLELTDQQRAAFESGRKKLDGAMKDGRGKVDKLSAALKAELQKDSPDRRKIHGYIDGLGKLHNEMQIRRMDAMLDLRETLSPKQKEKFRKMLDSQRKREPGKMERQRKAKKEKKRG